MFDMIVHSLGEYVLLNFPIAGTVFGILGMLLTIVTALDKVLPMLKINEKLKALFEVPFLGAVLSYLLRFSAIRMKKKDEP